MEYWKLVWVFAVAFIFGGYQSEGLWEIEKAALFQLKSFYQNWYLNVSLFLPLEELKSLDLRNNYIAGFIDSSSPYYLQDLFMNHKFLFKNIFFY
ncbi:hypothetical protein Gotri_001736 [Gossypium trilobum]|uniref:Uncharacterized protein n=1 Tax=Gossypium trilobum TaxID=34281 RepID=A0A7J9FFR2_9ROSI|nr:hypothetical protein [Gossypium trilobum]